MLRSMERDFRVQDGPEGHAVAGWRDLGIG